MFTLAVFIDALMQERDRTMVFQGLSVITLSLATVSAFGQMPGFRMEIEVANFTIYNFDSVDQTNWGRLPGPVTPEATPPAFGSFFATADVVAVNGKPVKGTWVLRQLNVNFRPQPTPGQAIADINRSGVFDEVFEFVAEDGSMIGSLMAYGLNAGARPPGTPLNFPGGNATIVGGTGAFLGVQGHVSTTLNFAGAAAIRQTSAREDPAGRRGFGGGARRIVVHLVAPHPPVVTGMFHSDFSPVTASNPARSGETIILSVTGLGPTIPGVEPSEPFPSSPLQQVNSPVEVTVNGQPATILTKIGWPESRGVYRVDIRLPQGITGIGKVELNAAWIPAAATTFAVQ